jgi:hypothetical protein
LFILVLGSVALAAGTPALVGDARGNPYQGIVDRNVFNLKPLPRPEDNLPPPEAPPKITLTGFTTILGDKRVLFKVQTAAKPPEKPKEESFILTEGQRDADIEVLEIDENAGVAKFNNHGTIQTLDLVNDGAKPAAAPPPVPIPPTARLNPAFLGQNPNTPQPVPAPRSIPTRTLRMPQIPGAPPNRTVPGNPGQPSPNLPR